MASSTSPAPPAGAHSAVTVNILMVSIRAANYISFAGYTGAAKVMDVMG